MPQTYSAISRKILSYLPSADAKSLRRALDFIRKAGFFEKKSVKKAAATLDMVEVLLECHVDEFTIIATILQGVLDADLTTIHEIEEIFGQEIATIVEGVNNINRVQYKEKMSDRDIEALQRMLFVMASDLRVIIIILAKRVQAMEHKHDCNKKEAYLLAKETFEVYIPLADLLGIWQIKAKLEDLCFQCLFPAEFKVLNKQLTHHAKIGEKFINKTIQKLIIASRKIGITIQTEGRMKHLYGIYQKVSGNRKKVGEVYDIYAIRIIVEDIADCYRILGVIHGMYSPRPGRFKDYIAAPKPNHYQSLHTTVQAEGNTVVEFQIRTKSMHEEAQFGVAAHFLYKTKEEIAPWMKDMLQLLKQYHEKGKVFGDLRAAALKERILVFTSEGNITDLPEQATVLDFAYFLGPQYGHCLKSAVVNGKNVSINTVLHTGDTIAVITDTYSHPKREWLNIVTTHLARKYLINFFRQESREKKIFMGMQTLERELQLAGQKTLDQLSRKEQKKLCTDLNYVTLDDLYVAVFEGIVQPVRVIFHLDPNHSYFTSALTFKIRKWWSGFWSSKKNQNKYPVSVKVISEDRFGLLNDLIQVMVRAKKSMLSVHSHRHYLLTYLYTNKITFEVESINELNTIITDLEKVDNVKKVRYSFPRYKIFILIFCLLLVLLCLIYFAYKLSITNN